MSEKKGIDVNISIKRKGEFTELHVNLNGKAQKVKFPTQLQVHLAHAILSDLIQPPQQRSSILTPNSNIIS